MSTIINFIKKYHINIILLLLFAGLILFVIPNQEARYLQSDIDTIKRKSHSVLLWTEIILVSVLFLLALRHLKKVSDLFYLAIGLGSAALAFFFLFNSIFLSSAYFLNSFSKNNTVEKSYAVVYVDNNMLLIWDNFLKKSIRADQIIKSSDNQSLNQGDTLIISFKKGLLGFTFDPTIKSIKAVTKTALYPNKNEFLFSFPIKK